MKKRSIFYILLAVVFGSLIVYRIVKNSSAENQGAGAPGRASAGGKGGSMPAMRVSGVIVETRDFANELSVSGTIEANEQVDIRTEVPGLITGIYFKEGTNVNKGQLLLKINDQELQAQLSQALTKQKLAAETEYRAGMLLKKEAISKEEYDIALADLRTAQAQTQVIRAQLAKTSILAPFNGRIGLRSVSNGDYLTPTTTVARLVSMNPVKLTFSIPEKYSGQIRENTEFTFNVAGSPKAFTGKVYAIEPGIETTTRTLQVRAQAPNPDGTLLPGSFAKINLPLSNIEDAILIPTQAIIPVQNGKKVFVSDSGKAKEVMVETSTRTASDILVLSGLKPGDTVLTTGVMSLKDGAPVKVSTGKTTN
ncbi:MAG TPA: efflux RND transporter periplasmic adaptor subunit [Sphingobacteriaceae bacterium]